MLTGLTHGHTQDHETDQAHIVHLGTDRRADCGSANRGGIQSHLCHFNVGTLTGGGAAFTKSLDVSGLTNAEYLFVRVTANYASAAAPHDAYASTLNLELYDGGSTVYWPSNTATFGAMAQDSTNTLIWSGLLPANSYPGGTTWWSNSWYPYTDASGPYYSTVSNVVVTIYPAPTPKNTFAAFNVGTLTGGGAAFNQSLNVSGLPNDEYLFARVTATHTSGTPPHDGWSSTLDLELYDGELMNFYWPSNTAPFGAMSQDGTSRLIWPGLLPVNSYQGGSNLTVKLVDPYTDASGPYYSAVSNVVVTIYPATTPRKTFAAFNVGTLTGGGAAFTKSLDVSGLTNVEYLFVRVTANYTSAAAPHDAYASTLNLELYDGGSTVYWPSNTATLRRHGPGQHQHAHLVGTVAGEFLSRREQLGGQTCGSLHGCQRPILFHREQRRGHDLSGHQHSSRATAPDHDPFRHQRDPGVADQCHGFTLQSATNLISTATWTTVSPVPVIVNGQNTVTNAITGRPAFYRLSQ